MSLTTKIPGLRIITRTLEYINRLAPLQEFADYDEYWETRADDGRVSRVLDRHKVIAGLIDDGASVLDIGCGDCAFQQHLLRARPGCKPLGLDTSTTAVQLAQAQGCNAQAIDPTMRLKDQVTDHWDVVTLMEVIEHVADAEDLMRQVLELKPSRIFVTIPNVGCLKHRLRLMLGGRFPITAIHYHMKEHIRFWTAKDFNQWAETLDIGVKSIHGQFDHGDKIVEWFVRKHPSMFADRVIYELRTRS